MLTDNAKNLSSAISEALYHTQSASIRVSKETREELGLTRTGSTKETLPGEQVQQYCVSILS